MDVTRFEAAFCVTRLDAGEPSTDLALRPEFSQARVSWQSSPERSHSVDYGAQDLSIQPQAHAEKPPASFSVRDRINNCLYVFQYLTLEVYEAKLKGRVAGPAQSFASTEAVQAHFLSL